MIVSHNGIRVDGRAMRTQGVSMRIRAYRTTIDPPVTIVTKESMRS
jgi:hypothetical protein